MYYLETKRLLTLEDAVRSEDRQRRVLYLALLSVLVLFSTHNVLAPNMTAVAQSFSFTSLQRDEYIGGHLTMVFFLSGLLSGVTFGLLSAVTARLPCLVGLCTATGLSCLAAAHLRSYTALVLVRAMCGWGVGGCLPLMYSMLGDLMPVEDRTLGSAYVSAVTGLGIFLGQMVGAVAGVGDWRTPFVLLGALCLGAAAAIHTYGREPARGQYDNLGEHNRLGEEYTPITSFKHIRKTMLSRTNFVIWAQAFPGNIPWGVALVFLNDYMVQDLRLSMTSALVAINVLAVMALLGNLTGGLIGKHLAKEQKWLMPLAAAVGCVARCSPMYMVFGWRHQLGVPDTLPKYVLFTATLGTAGFLGCLPSSLLGGMMLNVNLPTTRGIVFAAYAALEDFSKATGAVVVALLLPYVGSRDVAYEMCLLLWLVPGLLLLVSCTSIEADAKAVEAAMSEGLSEGLVRGTKHQARRNVQSLLKREPRAAKAEV